MSDFTLSDLRSVFGSVAIADVWYFLLSDQGRPGHHCCKYDFVIYPFW